MTRYLLDTNIISNPSKLAPSAELEIWMSMQEGESLFVSAWSLAEIWHGILLMPHGKKRASLEEWYAGPFGPERLFSDRILTFNVAAAHKWAKLMVEGRLAGRSRCLPDTIIASIALTQNCILVTDNERDFPDLPMLNPMRALDSSM